MATAANISSWNWVVETLANFEQVDLSVLMDLVKRTKGISDDLENNAREMISLRILESLFPPGSDTTTNASSSVDARISFDTTQKCQDVLRHILNETSRSSRKNKLESSKWDVQPFLAQKRSSLTKCKLQQLKEAILEGRHPLLASLKEKSGLIGGAKSIIRNSVACGNETCLNPGIGVDKAREDLLNKNLSPSVLVTNESATEIYGQPSLGDQTILINGCDRLSNASNPVNNLKVRSVSSQMAKTIEEPSGGFLQYTQTIEQNFSKEPMMDTFQGSTLPDGCNDEHVSSKNLRQICDRNFNESSPAKKLKVDSVCMQQNVNLNSVSTQETERIECSFRGLVQHFQTELCDLSKEPRVGLEDIRLSNGGDDESNFSKDSNDGKKREIMSIDEKKDNSGDKIQENALHGLLSFNGACTEDSLGNIDPAEINLCINCNEGGQMLVCSSNSCPIVIHESCLGSAATFDADQNFYCPFCAYSRAILEYKEAKRKVLLARNNLGAFLGFQNKCREKKSSEGLNGSVQNQPREENLSENIGTNDDGRNVNSVGKSRSNEENVVLAQPSVPSVNDNLSPVQKEIDVTNAENHGLNGDQIEGRTLLQQCEHNACSLKDKEVDRVSNGTNCGLTGEGLEGLTLLKECEFPKELDEQQTGGPVVHDCEPSTSSFISKEIGHVTNESNSCLMQDIQGSRKHEERQIAGQSVINSESKTSFKEISHENESHSEVQIQHAVLNHQNVTIPHETSTKKDVKSEDHEPSASKYSTRLRKRKPQDTYSPSPSLSLRRKVIPWTKLEEETLKEGVKKFSNGKDGVYPWKKILDFGGTVFENRNVVDLKDKWRNICKRISKPK